LVYPSLAMWQIIGRVKSGLDFFMISGDRMDFWWVGLDWVGGFTSSKYVLST
jgi:hypothetical protein